MHLPNHYLDPTVCLAAGALAAGGLGWAALRLRQSRPIPVAAVSVTAAGIFAAQMVNFPIAAGTSGHFVGGALAAIVLGLSPAILVMSVILVAQCFLLGDGGSAALGANIVNMALVAPLVGWCAYRLMCGDRPTTLWRMLSAALAAWLSIVAAAAACSIELAASGTHGFGETASAMLLVHAQIGIAEGLITCAAMLLAERWTAYEVSLPETQALARRRVVAVVLIVAAAILAITTPSSLLPDGLESVAAQLKFASPLAHGDGNS